jgi:hypothetical protein
LTYNLFVTDSGCGSLPRNVNLDPRTLPLYQLLRELLAAQFIPGITWISEPSNKEMAFSYLAESNEPSINTCYSCATILAAVPPIDQRQPTQDRGAAKI